MGVTINNKSTTTEPPVLLGRKPQRLVFLGRFSYEPHHNKTLNTIQGDKIEPEDFMVQKLIPDIESQETVNTLGQSFFIKVFPGYKWPPFFFF